jgi:hypothetical protein
VGSPWHPGVEHYQGNASTLGLTKLAEPAEDYV